MSDNAQTDPSASHIERVPGARRVRLVIDNENYLSDAQIREALKEESPTSESSFENEERLKREIPPHW